MNKNIGKIRDLTGQKFERLMVIDLAYMKDNQAYWNCKCDCGNEKIVKGKYLVAAETKSCGCLKREHAIELKTTVKHKTTVPYDVPFRKNLYYVWSAIKHRCYNKNNKHYKWYGARGIQVCDNWIDKTYGFENFYNWAIDNGYKEGLSIDRLDVNGNYDPQNCAWKTHTEQCNNMTTNILIEYNEEIKTAAEWKRHFNLNIGASAIRNRWDNGIRGEDLFKEIDFSKHMMFNINGISKTVEEWLDISGVSYSTFKLRVKKGITGNELITPPNKDKQSRVKDFQTVSNTYVIINNNQYSLKELSKVYDISIDTIRDRYNRGLRGEELISKNNLHKPHKNKKNKKQ